MILSQLRSGRLWNLILGHFTIDSYAGLLPVLYPLLIDRFHLSLATVGLVTLAYTGMAAISQPPFGWLADRLGTRLTGACLAWTAATYAGIGFAPNFPVLVVLAAVAGLGSGAFHPMGAINISTILPRQGRNTGMSIYVTGGTLGVAAGPLIGIALFGAFGLHGTGLTVLPGLVIGALLVWQLRWLPDRAATRDQRLAAGPRPPIPVLPLLVVIGVMMARSWTVFVLQSFIPTWYRSLGYSPSLYGPVATVLVLGSAIGMIGCGGLADRFGRRWVIVAAAILSLPAVVLFVQFPGPQGLIIGLLVGSLAASTAPLTLVMAQELMAGRTGLASGLLMGIGFVTGGIGVPVTGSIADHFGLDQALRLQVLVVLLTIVVALFLPSERYLRSLRERLQHASSGVDQDVAMAVVACEDAKERNPDRQPAEEVHH